MEKIRWCIQTKGGIELVEPNSNLANGYILKAEESLEALRKVKGNRDWTVSTAYYSMYFSLYAILMKIGVRCEMHACTIEFMKKFLSSHFSPTECRFVLDSLQARIDTQYYVDRKVEDKFVNEMIVTAPKFLVKCKEILTKIKESEVNTIRKQISVAK
ncbi:MAG: HEPN domain-containing protein [Candidatus Aenigmarchaeota archaeon]|nr:HEPN domain-containing protein [Candidatus Aenigmarchaeota archaeon]